MTGGLFYVRITSKLSVTSPLNKPVRLLLTMTHPKFPVEDLEKFAEYMGLNGIDSDLFYETYYKMNKEDDEYELYWEESYDSVEMG